MTGAGVPVRLLLVEDSENDAMLLLRVLRRGGYEPVYERVYTAEEMEWALEKAAARGEPFEIVVSDYYMPRFRAPDALGLLRGLGYDVPFIVVSGKIGEDAAVGVMKAGANDYLTKENMARLCPAIARELKEAGVRRERAKAEEALVRSEVRFRRLVEQAADAMFVHDAKGRLVDVNRRACESLGYSREELLGMSMTDVEIEAPEFPGGTWAHTPSGAARTLEGRHRRKDGTTFPVEASVGVLESEGRALFLVLVRNVTGRREDDEQLARLASFPELDPNPIVETNVAGRPTYLNPMAQAHFPDLRDLGAAHPALADLEEANRRVWSAGGRPFGREIEVGGRFYQQTISRTPEGGLLRIYGVDVTERRRAEDALREREERFRSLVQNASDIILVLDEGGTITYESPAVERVLGYAPEERVGSSVFDVIHPDDRAPVARVLSEHHDRPGPFPPVEYRVRDKGGVWRHFEAVGENLLHDPAIGGIVVNVRDVTGRRRTEEALRQSEELYRSVVEQAAEGIFLLDTETMRVLEANAALAATLGYAPEELRGLSFYDVSAHDRESVDRNAALATREGRLSLGERQYRRKDGALVDVEISISTLLYGGRRAMCVVAHDVTGRNRAERSLRDVREAERNRIARELHDSILQDIVYSLQEIQIFQVTSANGTEPALEEAADALRRSVEGLRGAIFELRLKETMEQSLVSSLDGLVDLNRRMARGSYELELIVREGVPPGLSGKPGRELVRIVQEALTNARRHAAASRVRVELGVDGDDLYAEVRDDGRGFDPAAARQGVGRHSMRQRALDLGGRVEVESGSGRGTRVLLRVPLGRLTGVNSSQQEDI